MLWLLRRPTARFQVVVAEHLAVVAGVVLPDRTSFSRGVAANTEGMIFVQSAPVLACQPGRACESFVSLVSLCAS